MQCPACQGDVLDIDVKCPHCGKPLGATGAHRMLGQVVLGQYELVDVLGQGGMSVVFKGKHKMTDQEVALKILPPELAAHSQVKSRFLEEAKALAALDHPNIVHLYNFGQENGYFVLAMQYVQGRTWERIILEAKRQEWKAACKIACDVLRALEYAHGRGVIHRDMKPSNVLVRSHDAMATVMDFGIAKMTTSTKLTATGQTMGTVRYMSPEQVRGQEVDLRTDLYSLGATLYEALTGDTPFDGATHFEIMTKHLSERAKPPSQLGIALPEIVEGALLKSLAKKPDDRFENAREMRKVLEAALRQEDVGLVETQRLNRDILGDTRKGAQTPAAPVRVATATPSGSLADELEPSLTAEVPARAKAGKSRAGLWLALGAIVLAGGGAAAFLTLRGKHDPQPAGWQPTVTDLDGVQMIAGGMFDGVAVETTGKVTPEEIASTYKATVKRARAFAAQKHLTFADPLQVAQIIAVPAGLFCDVRTYTSEVPKDCGDILGAARFTAAGTHRISVVADPAKLGAGMVAAVTNAVCYFEPVDDKATQHVDDVCTVMRDFKAAEIDNSASHHE